MLIVEHFGLLDPLIHVSDCFGCWVDVMPGELLFAGPLPEDGFRWWHRLIDLVLLVLLLLDFLLALPLIFFPVLLVLVVMRSGNIRRNIDALLKVLLFLELLLDCEYVLLLKSGLRRISTTGRPLHNVKRWHIRTENSAKNCTFEVRVILTDRPLGHIQTVEVPADCHHSLPQLPIAVDYLPESLHHVLGVQVKGSPTIVGANYDRVPLLVKILLLPGTHHIKEMLRGDRTQSAILALRGMSPADLRVDHLHEDSHQLLVESAGGFPGCPRSYIPVIYAECGMQTESPLGRESIPLLVHTVTELMSV